MWMEQVIKQYSPAGHWRVSMPCESCIGVRFSFWSYMLACHRNLAGYGCGYFIDFCWKEKLFLSKIFRELKHRIVGPAIFLIFKAFLLGLHAAGCIFFINNICIDRLAANGMLVLLLRYSETYRTWCKSLKYALTGPVNLGMCHSRIYCSIQGLTPNQSSTKPFTSMLCG